jgi:hypothetical protein
MNIIYKFSRKHYITFFFVILFLLFFLVKSSIREGITPDPGKTPGPRNSPGPNTACDPSVNLSPDPNDTQLGSLIQSHIQDTTSELESYSAQLKQIINKYKNISTCLSIGQINISSPNSYPIVTIDDPISGSIQQKLNYILPKGQQGSIGPVGPYAGALGVWGKKGENGKIDVEFTRKKVRGKGRQVQISRLNFLCLSLLIFC